MLLDKLDEFTRRARLRIITNGVDLDYFQPAPLPVASRPVPRLVFTGAMDYYANIEAVEWFTKEVFPLIREQEPGAEFLIVGSHPADRVKRLARQTGVTVTGFVEDVRPFLREATVCVVPLRIARGVQNKLLEAMAAGKAAVATPEAIAGLRVVSGEQLLTASAPGEFAQAALKLIRDDRLRESLGRQARRFVETEHDWTPLLQKLAELLETVAQRNPDSETRKARAMSRF